LSGRLRNIATVLVVCGCCLLAAAPALASDACSVKQAKRDVARAQHRLTEAKRVLAATRHYSADYGPKVGQWTRLSRRVGWGWGQLSTLMFVIDRESGGSAHAANPASSARGLTQQMSIWWNGKWHYDPFNPRLNLYYAHRIWHMEGFAPWSM
jgi:hypothetical protein